MKINGVICQSLPSKAA